MATVRLKSQFNGFTEAKSYLSRRRTVLETTLTVDHIQLR
jgi:hypothetical protein